MANRYMDKAVYIRETTNGKTKRVKIPGVTIQNGFNVIRVFLDHEKYSEAYIQSWTKNYTFESRGGRAE